MGKEINWLDKRFKKEILDYKYLIEKFKNVDVTDRKTHDELGRNFQIICNDYFHNALIARKYANTNVLETHYKLLESYKKSKTTPDFESALKNLAKETDLVIPFLASQATHFFNPDTPICSRFILDGLNMTFTTNNIEQICKDYNNLTESIHDFCNTPKGQEIIKTFRNTFNERINKNITDTKIIDFYFWFTTLDKTK